MIEPEQSASNTPCKRKYKDASEYKRNKIKRSILRADAYENHKGNLVPAKTPLYDCGCKRTCLETIGEDNIQDLFCKFHDIKSKNEQDIYLQGLIDVENVKTRRPRTETPRRNSAVYQYYLIIGSERKNVCLKAFLNSLGITAKRVRRIRELKQSGKTPEDKRGKNVSFTLSQETKALVREHISSFPVKEYTVFFTFCESCKGFTDDLLTIHDSIVL